MTSRSHGRERAFFYACTAYHKRGTAVCGNSLTMRIERIDQAVLRTLGGDVLRPSVVMAILDGVLETKARSLEKRDSLFILDFVSFHKPRGFLITFDCDQDNREISEATVFEGGLAAPPVREPRALFVP